MIVVKANTGYNPRVRSDAGYDPEPCGELQSEWWLNKLLSGAVARAAHACCIAWFGHWS